MECSVCFFVLLIERGVGDPLPDISLFNGANLIGIIVLVFAFHAALAT